MGLFVDEIIDRYIGRDNLPMIVIKRKVEYGSHIEYESIYHIIHHHHFISSDYLSEHEKNGYSTDMGFSNDIRCSNGIHRLDGPARIDMSMSGRWHYAQWRVHGNFHRMDGPAIINYSQNHSLWYLFGKLISDPDKLFNKWSRYGISSNWWEWSDEERMIFKLVFGGLYE